MLQEFLETTAKRIRGHVVQENDETKQVLFEMYKKHGMWICPCSVVVQGFPVKRCPCKEGIADVREGRTCHCGIFTGEN